MASFYDSQDEGTRGVREARGFGRPQEELDFNNNEKLLDMFKSLRSQSNNYKSMCETLKKESKQKDKQIEGLIKRQQILEEELRSKGKILQEEVKGKEGYKRELEEIKIKGVEKFYGEEMRCLKNKIQQMEGLLESSNQEKRKIMEMWTLEKIQFEAKIKQLSIQTQKINEYNEKLEIQNAKYKEKNICLQNQLKKIKINFDQQKYHHQWDGKSFQIQHLEEKINLLQKQNSQLSFKYQKSREQVFSLEDIILKLQQQIGMIETKAKASECQKIKISKMYKQFCKQMQPVNSEISKLKQKVENFSTLFKKAAEIGDELATRVKRQFIGEMAALAKSCQYRLNKLKEEHIKLANLNKQPINKSKKNLHKKSMSISLEKQYRTERKRSIYESIQNIQPLTDRVLIASNMNEQKKSNCSNETKTSKSIPLLQIQNIQDKIQKQRILMEKTIRDKMFKKKQQMQSFGKLNQNKFSEDYFRVFQN